MDCARMAADSAFTRDALVSAFKRVGMWPLDPRKVAVDEVNKGADIPSDEADLPTLTRPLLPIVRKKLREATVVYGTLSTAGRTTLLTAPEHFSALESLEAERVAKAAEAAEAKEQREKRTAERAVEKEAERLAVAGRKAAAAEKRATKEMTACCKAWNRRWAAVTAEFLEEAAARNRRLSQNGYKQHQRRQADRQRQRLCLWTPPRCAMTPITGEEQEADVGMVCFGDAGCRAWPGPGGGGGGGGGRGGGGGGGGRQWWRREHGGGLW